MSLSKNKLNLRLELTKKSIYSVYLKEGTKSSLFHSILNRVLVLVKMPVCIALYEDRGEQISPHYRFKYLNKEFIVERNHSDIYHTVIENEYNKNKLFLSDEYISNVIPVYGTKYAFLIFRINFDHNDVSRKPIFTLVRESKNKQIVSSDNYIYNCFFESFKISDEIKSTKDDAFCKAIEASIENLNSLKLELPLIEAGNNDSISLAFEKDYKLQLVNNEVGIINNIFYRLKNVVNSIFTPSNGAHLTNIFFFTKHYTRVGNTRYRSKEHNGYNYNTGFIIPNHQRVEMIEFLTSLKKSSIPESMEFYKKNYGQLYSDILEQDFNVSDLQTALDEKFWEELYKENGARNIVNILHESIGAYARSFTDAVFINGVVHYRQPYEKIHKGLDRVDGFRNYLKINNFRSIPRNKQNDFLRVVVAYYLFNSICDATKNTSKFLVTFPIEVAGCIHTVLAMTINMNKDLPYAGEKSNSWEYLYYYYNNVVLPFEHELRIGLKSWYLNEILTQTEEQIKVALVRANFINIKQTHFDKALCKSNEHFSNLTRFVPFEQIQIMLFIKTTNNNKNNFKYLSIDICDVFEIRYKVGRNKFFQPIYGSSKNRFNSIKQRDLSNMGNKLKHHIEKFVVDQMP